MKVGSTYCQLAFELGIGRYWYRYRKYQHISIGDKKDCRYTEISAMGSNTWITIAQSVDKESREHQLSRISSIGMSAKRISVYQQNCCISPTRRYMKQKSMACLMSYICSMSTMLIVKGATTGLYLRGPSLVPWIYRKIFVIDSFTLKWSVSTLQSLHLTELSAMLCIMTYYHSIPKGI